MSTFRYYIHTSAVFPYPHPTTPSKEATLAWSRSPTISHTLALLHPDEQSAVTRFFHPGDASRCLSSILLKHLAICRGAGVPWRKSTISQQRDIRNGKPFYAEGGVEFNVSHHGEYVVCIGTTIPGARVGIDVVQVDLQKDLKRMTGPNGFREWVDVFSDVLSQEERDEAVRIAGAEGVEKGLRRFYTVWACKEAYIKLTSDALMAPWLKELDFPGLEIPEAAQDNETWGRPVYVEVKLQGKLVRGTRIELVGLGKDYIVASAFDRDVPLAAFENVTIAADGSALQYIAASDSNQHIRMYSLKD